MKKKIKTEVKSYVWDFGDGAVHQYEDESPVVHRAKSLEDAYKKFYYLKSSNGGPRVTLGVESEHHIALIEKYAHTRFELGQLSRDIKPLENKREALKENSRILRDLACALPEEEIPF